MGINSELVSCAHVSSSPSLLWGFVCSSHSWQNRAKPSARISSLWQHAVTATFSNFWFSLWRNPLTCTPNSGFRTIQIKVNTCKWVFSAKLRPFGRKRPFLLHPAQQETAPAPAPIPQPRAPLHQGSCRRRVQHAEGHAGTPSCKPPAPPKGCAKRSHKSSGGQSLPADGVKARSPSRNSSTLLFLSVKMHVFFQQACKLGFLKNLKYVVTEAAYSNAVSVLGAVLWEDQPSFFLSELSSP